VLMIAPREGVILGWIWGDCAKVREAIELPFWVVSGVGPGTGVLFGVDMPQEERGFWFFSGPF